MTRKQSLAIEIYKTVRIYCKIVAIQSVYLLYLLKVKRCIHKQLYQNFWQSVKQQKFQA